MKDDVSSLLDGDLDESTAKRVLDHVRRNDSARSQWDVYCLIGDSLRGDPALKPGFCDDVMARIHAEPTLLAPSPDRSAEKSAEASGRFRRMFALAASVVAFGVVGWAVTSVVGQSVSEPLIIADESPSTVMTADSADPHRNFVFVHQAMNGGGTVPSAVHFVRTVAADDRVRR